MNLSNEEMKARSVLGPSPKHNINPDIEKPISKGAV